MLPEIPVSLAASPSQGGTAIFSYGHLPDSLRQGEHQARSSKASLCTLQLICDVWERFCAAWSLRWDHLPPKTPSSKTGRVWINTGVYSCPSLNLCSYVTSTMENQPLTALPFTLRWRECYQGWKHEYRRVPGVLGGRSMSQRLLEEPVPYLVLLKSKTFPALGFTRIQEVNRQSKGSTITRHKFRSNSSFTQFSQLLTKDGTLVSEHLNY